MTSQGAGATELKPCPFCNAAIKHIESLARSFNPPRVYHEYHHPKNDCMLYDGMISGFSDDPAPRLKWIEAWNRRAASPSPPPGVGEATFDAWFNAQDANVIDSMARRAVACAAWHDARRTFSGALVPSSLLKEAEEALRLLRDAHKRTCMARGLSEEEADALPSIYRASDWLARLGAAT